MTKRYLTVLRTVFVALIATAIVCIPLNTAFAQRSIDDHRDAASGLAAKDQTVFINAEGESGVKAMRSYARSNYIWPYSYGPTYPAVDVYEKDVVWTPAGTFREQSELPIAGELRSAMNQNQQAGQYFVVQYHDEVVRDEKDLRSVIEANGGRVVDSPNSGSLVALLNHASLQAVQSSVGFLAAIPYHGAFKLDATIGRTPLPDPIKALSDVYTLEVLLWPGEEQAAAVAEVERVGGAVVNLFGDTLIVELPRNLLAPLANIDAVRYVGERVPNQKLGEETTSIIQTASAPVSGPDVTKPYHDAGIMGGGLNLCAFDLATDCTIQFEAVDCAGGGLNTKCLGEQIIMVLDSGFSLDAGDLADTRTSAGTAGPAHRKVRVYEATNQFGGQGDTSGCDAPAQGGFSHGHVVSATALGNATNVSTDYGAGWNAFDQQNNSWELDGVAPAAVLVGYDAQVTPPNGSCSDPGLDSIIAGDLFNGAAPDNGPCPNATQCPGSLGKAYEEHGARITNFSWGANNNTYSVGAADIDTFMLDKGDALVFVSAGNYSQDVIPAGGDGIPDSLTLGSPATTKNGFAIGASRTAGANQQESRAGFSSVGPAVNTTVNRIAPQLMAPGADTGNPLGVASEFTCRSNDNDQVGTVICDIISGAAGTSFASPAAAGAAALVRDYFRQGFHPTGTQKLSDSREIGSCGLKSTLIASADFMTGANLTRAHRWNNEQGYGRIQLDNVLPLEAWSRSPLGMLLSDPQSATSDLGLPSTISSGQSFTTTFDVVNDDYELRVAIAWNDVVNATLRNDIDLTLISPSGIEYRGNYFTDDNDQDGVPEVGEDCGGIGSADSDTANGLIDQDRWSLPVCSNTRVQGKSLAARPFDNSNPSEAIFLSPDPQNDNVDVNGEQVEEGTCTPGSTANANGPCDNNLDCRLVLPGNMGDGECEIYKDYRQTEIGTWTMIVKAGPTVISGAQEICASVAGGVTLGSTVRFGEGSYSCNERSTITVTEVAEGGTFPDLSPSEGEVTARTTVQVIDGDPDSPTFDTVVDTETGIGFTQAPGGLKFVSDEVQLTDQTGREPGNGVLDVRDGDGLRVVYTDKDVDTGNLTVLRQNSSTVDCRVNIGFGSIVFAQYGQDSGILVQGGCERNARGEFYFGFPDRYMDADESLILSFAFNSNEQEDLESVVAALSCVGIDADSPGTCLPSGAGCEETECGGPCDPRRENNPPCTELAILDSPNFVGFVPANAAHAANFAVQVAGDGPGEVFEESVCRDQVTPCTVANQAVTCSGIGDQTCVQPVITVELLLAVEASVSGQTKSGLAVSRQRLNVDPTTTWYSTDYPGGGSEVLDYGPGTASNNDEIALDPVTENANFQSNDYRFETFQFSPITAGGGNQNLLSPWNFDGNNGGFTVGLAAPSDETAADIFNIANWGEDKNFNNIEDGVCEDDPSVACYDFGTDTDERCPASTDNCGSPGSCTGVCSTVEDNAGGTGFTQNWNTKGGCGWQTRATGECSLDAERGCFATADCNGTCHVLNNEIASSFDACGSGQPACPNVQVCSDQVDNPNPLNPCTNDADCGGVPGACVFAIQSCQGNAGTCGGVNGNHTGGVWHTGQIGTFSAANDTCTGAAGSACANYKSIAGSGGQLLWWELLVTPVMEKVNQNIGADGLPEATIEIFDMGWNTNVNLSDGQAAYTWEIDTDLETLDPVDLFSDTTILGIGGGAYGAISLGSNPDLTNGWPVFGTQCSCTTGAMGPCTDLFGCEAGSCTVSGDPCHVAADCDAGVCTGTAGSCFSNLDCVAGSCDAGGDGSALGEECHTNADCTAITAGSLCTGAPETCTATAPEGCVNAPLCDCTGGQTTNGSAGNNRVGDAGCFFEGNIAAVNYIDLGVAHPLDDDQDNDGDAAIDEYVQDDGPYRNHDVVAFNGPDMRFGTLEDIFGDTGNSFQAAIGFIAFEGTPSSQAMQSYGVAVDDVVVKWREFKLDADATDCDESGSCAVVELGQANIFQGQTVLTITVLDAIPDAVNDCDLDGATDGTNDCNGVNGPDVVVKATSEAEVTGEITFLDLVAGSEYKGTLAISSLSDSPGVLFVSQEGAEFPTVTVTYKDNDFDGNGTPCPNDVDPAKHGNVQAFSTVLLGSFCEVVVVGTEISDNGDGDEFADQDETVDMTICLLNNCGVDLNNCSGRLFSNSANVDCILDSVIDVGDLPDSEDIICITDPFRWKVKDINRPSVDAAFDATFSFTMSCDEIDALETQQNFTLALDLDLDDLGQSPIAWTEDFETGALAGTKFFAENLDAGLPGANNSEGRINGDGWRCQYSDPDWPNSNSYGNDIALDCFPGSSLPASNDSYWNVDGTGTGGPDGGRAKSGIFSLYYGIYLPAESDFTTPMAAVESVATNNPINLGIGAPELSWWQQVSLVDGRFLNIPASRSADRGVVQYKQLDSGGADVTDWITLTPFQNSYDTQDYDFYFNCMFDPVDDGTTEDDFFDPTDPERRLGPSSTCHPEFTYSCIGDTDEAFQVENICNASVQPGPGDAGALGTGTWVRSKIDLTSIKGRRIDLRYLVSGLKASAETHDGQFDAVNPGEWDNGWWIDDVTIDESLTDPAQVLIDINNVQHCAGNDAVGCLTNADCTNAGVAGPCSGIAPQCGDTCAAVTAVVETTPETNANPATETLAAPGQPIELDATASNGTCLDGSLQYQFKKNGAILRAFSENSVLLDAPADGDVYTVEVRCSTGDDSAPCVDSTTVTVTVICPTNGGVAAPFPETVFGAKVGPGSYQMQWTVPRAFDALQGGLAAVSSYGGTQSSGSGNTFAAGGSNQYYLFRAAGEFCNEIGSWTTGGSGECAGIPTPCDRDADITP